MPLAKADWSSKWLTKKKPRKRLRKRLLPKRLLPKLRLLRLRLLKLLLRRLRLPRLPAPEAAAPVAAAPEAAPAEHGCSGSRPKPAVLRAVAAAVAAVRAAAVAVAAIAAAADAVTIAVVAAPRDDGGEELIEKLVHINRVSKTVKGGKRFGFAALVVVGDGKGRAGFGHGKAREVPEAISKATAAAKKAMVRVPLRDGRTLHHDGNGHFGAGKVTVRSAPSGTGIIAGGPMRAVFESLGVADVVTKSVGTSNPYNMIRATFEALKEQTSPRSVAQRRGKKVSDLLGRGGMQGAEAEAVAEAIAE